MDGELWKVKKRSLDEMDLRSGKNKKGEPSETDNHKNNGY